METAFGRAMLDSLNGQHQRVTMKMVGGPSMQMNCGDYLTTRPEENQILERVQLSEHGRVLDLGCGVGRHLERIRSLHANVECWGADYCDLLRAHCQAQIAAPATFVPTVHDVPDCSFDLILLMGNGLGVLGDEGAARTHLTRLVGALTPTGSIVVETGNPFGPGYATHDFTIDYAEHRDGPFPWGYADRNWLTSTLRNLGCTVTTERSHAPGGMFFIAVGTKGAFDHHAPR